jgi:hypothetical protein
MQTIRYIILGILLVLSWITMFFMAMSAKANDREKLWMVCGMTQANGEDLDYHFAVETPFDGMIRETQITRGKKVLVHEPKDRPRWGVAEVGDYFIMTSMFDPRLQIITTAKAGPPNPQNVSLNPAVVLYSSKALAKGTCGVIVPA